MKEESCMRSSQMYNSSTMSRNPYKYGICNGKIPEKSVNQTTILSLMRTAITGRKYVCHSTIRMLEEEATK